MKGGNVERMFDGTSPVNDRRKTINLFLCVSIYVSPYPLLLFIYGNMGR